MYNGLHDRRHRVLIFSNRGVTLIELLIAAGLATMLSLTAALVLRFMYQSSLAASIQGTRQQLLIDFRQYAGDPASLANSLHQTGNGAFLACVCGGSGGCTSGAAGAFTLYQPGDIPPQSNPKYYDAHGHPCAPSTAPKCLIQTQTQFIAQCRPRMLTTVAHGGTQGTSPGDPKPMATCATGADPDPADIVGVVFTVQQNPASIGKGSAPDFKAISSVAYTQVTNLVAPIGPGACP